MLRCDPQRLPPQSLRSRRWHVSAVTKTRLYLFDRNGNDENRYNRDVLNLYGIHERARC